MDCIIIGRRDALTTSEISITGMSCNHCVMTVKKELSRISALTVRDVKIGSACIEYDESKVTMAEIRAAIEEAGFAIAH